MAKITWNPKKLEALLRRQEGLQGIANEIHRDREIVDQNRGAMIRKRAEVISQGNYTGANIEAIDAEIAKLEKDRAAINARYSELSQSQRDILTLLSACENFLRSKKADPDPPGQFRGYTGYTAKTKGGQGS